MELLRRAGFRNHIDSYQRTKEKCHYNEVGGTSGEGLLSHGFALDPKDIDDNACVRDQGKEKGKYGVHGGQDESCKLHWVGVAARKLQYWG